MNHITKIIEAAAIEAGTNPEEVTGTRRTARAVLGRHAAMVVARNEGRTLVETGAAFRRDHGTVIHAMNRAATDKRLQAVVSRTTARLASKFSGCSWDASPLSTLPPMPVA